MWGKAIIASFIFFALFIGSLVTVCVRQDNSLVTKDYYAEEINYQQQIDRMANTRNLQVKPSIAIQDHHLVIDYPHLSRVTKGTLQIYRPSDASMDRLFELKSDTSGIVVLDVSTLNTGLYKVKLAWQEGDAGYYLEESIVL